MAGQLELPAHSAVTDPRMPRHTNNIDNRGIKVRHVCAQNRNTTVKQGPYGNYFLIFFFYLFLFNFRSAVVNALKNLQQKINRMELEKKEAETNCQQLSHDVTNHQEVSSVYAAPGRSVSNQPGPGRSDTEGK